MNKLCERVGEAADATLAWIANAATPKRASNAATTTRSSCGFPHTLTEYNQ
jgi:hypothetical protein